MWVIISALQDWQKLLWWNSGGFRNKALAKEYLLLCVCTWQPKEFYLFSHLKEDVKKRILRCWSSKPGPISQREDRWGCFKWSVHVHVIDLEDFTTSHRGDEEGLHGAREEGPVHQSYKNKWAPTQLSGLSHYCTSPTYWFIPPYILTRPWHNSVTWLQMLNELFLELENNFDCSFGFTFISIKHYYLTKYALLLWNNAASVIK